MKDPAFLFYSSDFLADTILLTNEQVGQYIRLLCLQHQNGRLSEKDMLKICGNYDEDIFVKFVIDEAGMYYNQRLDDEIKRRIAYSESRRRNRQSKNKDMKNICESHDEHMGTGTETKTIILNNNSRKVFKKPTLEEVRSYCQERNNNVDPESYIDFYEAKGWMLGQNKMKDWKASVRTWEKNAKKMANEQPERNSVYDNAF